MERVIIQPTGSKVSRIHYNDTTNNLVNLKSIRSFVNTKIHNQQYIFISFDYGYVYFEGGKVIEIQED